MKGIIYFEKSGDVYSMYFIETVHPDLSSLIKGKDSVDVFSLENHHCDAKYIDEFKEYFFKTLPYKTTSLLINAENHLGQHYEDSITMYSAYGSIKYLKENRHKMKPTYEKLTLNNKDIIFVIRDNILIDVIAGSKKAANSKKK